VKAAIVFHSVSGNNLEIAKTFQQALVKLKVETDLFRVEDNDLNKWVEMYPIVDKYRGKIEAVPVANAVAMKGYDLVVLGSPTYYGDVSGEMKAFMDSCAPLWQNADLFGKILFAWTTAASEEGGGHICLKSIVNFGMHMGMIYVPVPSNLLQGAFPAYGLIHYCSETGDKRIDGRMSEGINKMAKILKSIASKLLL